MNLLAVILTATTMLVHALTGCCWHEMAASHAVHSLDTHSISRVAEHHDACGNHQQGSHKPLPGTPHEPGCQETVGSFVIAPETQTPSLALNLLAAPLPIVASSSFAPAGLVTVNFSPPAPEPTRLHLALAVLLI